ncbi:hypothetical protein AtubIFM57143_006381 [Aspergillus tubingensis]|nr:hypothetical protein AtubIFM57143_006381 [Aspergillus tubingensis]
MTTKEGSRPDDYPHLTSLFRSMKTQYDVVVIGSGYGAGVAASRMARAGKSVAVLELGWERRPGSFPRSLFQCFGDLNISGISRWRLPDKPTRLFQLILGDGQHALVARGVFLETDRETLQMSVWPSEIRNDTFVLRPYYSRAAEMLQPSPYPEDHPRLLKLEAIQTQAEWLGKAVSFYRTPLTTFFRRERNHVGVMMQENRGSGNESTGLDDGSKNTVATTYLTDAWNWGVEIFCGCEVRFIEQAPNQEGYVVYFAWHGRGRSAFGEEVKTQLFWVKAGVIYLERVVFPWGRRFGDNGDFASLKRLRSANFTHGGKEYVREWGHAGLWIQQRLQGRDREEVTVHPLGGANMSSTGTGRGGVTNHLGQVYKGHGNATHEGLVCCDASVIPTALGVNPMATITALAERSIDLISKKRQFFIDTDTPNGRLGVYSQPMVSRRVEHGFQKAAKVDQAPLSIGWQFSEVLDGHIYMQSNDLGSDACETLGRSSSCTMRMFLTIEICRRIGESSDAEHGMVLTILDTFGLQYEGICTGTVACRGLSRGPMRVVDGRIRFFIPSEKQAESTALRYSLQLLSLEDISYKLEGYKEIDSTSAISIRGMWEATTKVNVHITRDDEMKVGAGVLRISWPSFRRQMRTFRTTFPFRFRLVPALVLFLAYFTLQLVVVFLRPFAPARKSRCSSHPPPGPKEQPCNITMLRTTDGVTVRLQEYEPLPDTNEAIKGEFLGSQPVLFIPGVTGNAAYSTFALPYLRCNMVDYFTARGCRCYVLTPRWGSNAKTSAQCTVYDCRLDIAAALQLF